MQRKELLKALLAVKPGIASKNSIESMMYFYFAGEAVISYNDIVSIQYPLKTDFTAFVNANDFFKVLSRIKSDSVSFKMAKDALEMRSSNMLNQFATIFDEDVVSRISTVQETMKGVKMKSLPNNFVEAVNLCIHIASKSESDQMLTCLYIKDKDMVATDNIRIAHFKMQSPVDEMMIKASEMKAILDIKPTKYAATKSWVHFKNDDGCIFSIRRIKGNYPDMLKFMDFSGVSVELPKKILDGIDVASVFAENIDDAIKVSIRKGKYRLYKESASGKFDFRDNIKYNGKDIDFSINPNLLMDMMNHSTNIIVGEQSIRLEADHFRLVTSLFIE